MGLLEQVTSPADLRDLTDDQLDALASEIRDVLVRTCAPRGGHLGPNLGVVELTLAIHRVFDSPARPGRLRHRPPGLRAQAAHRPRRGSSTRCARRAACPATRARPSPSTTSSRTPTPRPSLSYADGLAKAYAIRGEDRHVVAVIGDGALTGGMAWEALNNIAVGKDRKLVIVVNDNGRSYTPTVGGLATHLDHAAHQPALRADPRPGQEAPQRGPGRRPGRVRRAARDEEGPEGRARPAGHVRGPRPEVRRPGRRPRPRRRWSRRWRQAKRFGGPVIVHAITRKGFGYDPAERNEADQFHQLGAVRRRDRRGAPRRAGSGPTSSPTRSSRSASARQDVVGDHRRDAAPGRAAPLRRARSPSAPSTSASPSSTPSPRPPASRWAGCTRSSRSTRRSSTAPSTRS